MHERLRVDVLVVLGEVEPTFERFVDHASVVAARQSQLRFDGGAQQRAAVFIEAFPLHDDAGRRTAKSFDVCNRQTHVFETRRFERLEAEHIADDRRGEIRDRAFLKQRKVVRDVAEILPGLVRHRLDPVGLGAIHVARG